MFASIAAFEFRYQLRNPVFWVSTLAYFLLVFGSVTVDQVQIGGGGNVHKNGPLAILDTMIVMSVFFMFIATAFVAGAVVRDDDTRFAGIIRATRMTKAQYLFGRFVGSFLTGALVLLAVPLAMFVGSLMPWVDPETLGPNRLRDYAFAYLVIGVPAAFLTSALFFALTTATRSMLSAYVGAVALFLGYFIAAATVGKRPAFREAFAWAEPFGSGAVGYATQYWTPAERNDLLPALAGPLLGGRLIWIGIGVAALAVAYAVFRFEVRGSKRAAATPAAADVAPALVGPLPIPRFAAARGAQFMARLRLEMRQIFRSPAYPILIVLALINAVANLWFTAEMFGTQILPVTRVYVSALSGTFALFAIIVAIYYGGELVWRDRDRRINEIVDATPLPDWALLLPKVVAIAAVLATTLLAGMAAGIAVQLVKGYTHFEVDKYLLWYVLPLTYDFTLIAILSVFVQSLVPAKPVGWGIMILYLIGTTVLANVGFEHNLYNYGGLPGVPLSDMNGSGRFYEAAIAFRIYWGAIAVVLLVIAQLLWRRGTATRLGQRLHSVGPRLRGPAGAVAAVAVLTAVGMGAWIFHNTNVLNEYRTTTATEDWQADYEKTLLPFEKMPRPSVEHVVLNVTIFPHDRRVDTTGSYALVNRTTAPIADVFIRADHDLVVLELHLPGATTGRSWPRFNDRMLHLATPLLPGEARTLTFRTQRWQHGFRNSGNETQVVDNGTFLNNGEIAPTVGMGREGLLIDRTVRRKHGLPADLRMPKLGDPTALAHNYIGADWTTSDITVTTDAGQTPIAPGVRVADTVAGDRRTARFVDTVPILNFFSVQSARYVERRVRHAGIDLSVYYDAQHPRNVATMLEGLADGLDYYQANFGPYQFPYVRIVEFPDFAQFAQAFAGTIPYSEGIGFIADVSDPDKLDYPYYVTAHELGHQWWAHQLVGADMQGATAMSETLAQYSALMVMEHRYGRDAMRRFLKFELDNYLRSRGSERVEELPLERVEAGQGYIHYRKGSLVMYLLKDRMGEAAVNRALRRLLDQYRFKGAPYPMSTALVAALRAEATPDVQPLITDLFERITLWDMKASDPKVTRRSDGRFDVALTVTAHKRYADGQGKETEAPLAQAIDVGLFSAEPGRGAFSAKSVIALERRPIRSGVQRVNLTVATAPTWVGVDPYNTFIDRNSDDNVVAVGR